MREKLIELLEIVTREYAEEIADYLIENGIVIPVRCGECAYLNEYGICKFHYDRIRFREQFVGKNDYCSRGIPKEDEE